MHLPLASSISARRLAIAAFACLAMLLGACGGSSESVATAGTATDAEPAAAAASEEDHDEDEDHDEEDHDEEDHDEEDHDEEDHDHEDHDDEDSASGGLDAHVHGTAELFVAWTGKDVVVDFVSPAENIFGFEYEPTSDEDVALVQERTEILTSPDLIVFNDQAACSLADDIDSDFVVEGSHAEVTAAWLFACDEPSEISQLDLSALFSEFPGIEDLDVQWTSDSGQSAAELSPSSTVLELG